MEPIVASSRFRGTFFDRSSPMNSIIYIVGLIVIVIFILSFLGLT